MARRCHIAVAATVVSASLSGVALADAEEHRFAVGATGVVASANTGGGSATAPLGSLELRYGYGWKNWLELGGVLFGAGGARVTFDDVTLDNQPGDLRASLIVGGAGLQLRTVGGIELSGAFWRTHPFVTVGAGVVGLALRDQQLMDSGIGISTPGDDLSLHPYGELELGIEHRFGAGFAVALVGAGRYAGDAYAAASVRLDLAWYWY